MTGPWSAIVNNFITNVGGETVNERIKLIRLMRSTSHKFGDP